MNTHIIKVWYNEGGSGEYTAFEEVFNSSELAKRLCNLFASGQKFVIYEANCILDKS